MRLAVIIFFLGWPSLVFASLGDHESSIDKDQEQIAGRQKAVTPKGNFKIHEMTAHGHRVREFVNSKGLVFAVSWQGVADPDLSVLMGNYYQELQTARANQKLAHGRKPLVIKSENFTYAKSGHPRNLHTIVYLNGQLPEGVRAEDLK